MHNLSVNFLLAGCFITDSVYYGYASVWPKRRRELVLRYGNAAKRPFSLILTLDDSIIYVFLKRIAALSREQGVQLLS